MKKNIRRIISALAIVMAILTIYLMASNIVAMKKEKPVRIFGYSFSYVPTNSMEPVIKVDDMVLFKKVKYDDLKTGDIIVYRSNLDETKGVYIIHRIKEVTDDGFVMLGDNNNNIVDKELVTSNMLIGKYIKVINFFNVGKLVSNKNLVFTLLIIVIIFIIVMEVVNIYVTYMKDKGKKKEEKNIRDELLEEIRQELLEEIKKEKETE